MANWILLRTTKLRRDSSFDAIYPESIHIPEPTPIPEWESARESQSETLESELVLERITSRVSTSPKNNASFTSTFGSFVAIARIIAAYDSIVYS